MDTFRSASAVLLSSLILGGSFIIGKNIESEPDMPAMITVQGEGKVQAIPDIALLNFGVQTGRQKTSQQSMQILAERMNAIIAAVEAAGVEKKDISTQSLRMNPAYDYVEGERRDVGFEANQNLQVKVRDVDNISTILDAAVRKGANQVGNVSFTIDDMTSLQEQARKEAIAKAKANAKILAKDLGVTLGDLQGFNENGGYPVSPVMMRMQSMGMEEAMDSMAPNIPAGEQDVQVTVSLTYEVR